MSITIKPSTSNAGAFELEFTNPKCRNGRCIIYVVQGPPRAPFHGWDGNVEAPTVTPSIGCDSRCGWHGHIIGGFVTP